MTLLIRHYRTPEEPQRLTASPLIHPASMGRGLGTSLNAWAQQRAGELITALPNDQRAVLQFWCK